MLKEKIALSDIKSAPWIVHQTRIHIFFAYSVHISSMQYFELNWAVAVVVTTEHCCCYCWFLLLHRFCSFRRCFFFVSFLSFFLFFSFCMQYFQHFSINRCALVYALLWCLFLRFSLKMHVAPHNSKKKTRTHIKALVAWCLFVQMRTAISLRFAK